MAKIHHLTNQTSITDNQSTNIGYGGPQDSSVYSGNESPMMSYSYPIDPWNNTQHNLHGMYSGLLAQDNIYPSTLCHQNPSENKSSQPPLFPSFETCFQTSGYSLGNHFPQQFSVSDLSVNPFQDRSVVNYNNTSVCTQESLESPPVDIPASSGNDEILDVDSFSPSPTFCNEQNQTNPGPSSTSSAGYTSGYQSCEGSTENSPLGSTNFGHPLYDIHLRPIDKGQSAFYLQEQTTLQNCTAPDLSPVLQHARRPDLYSVPSGQISNPCSVQSNDLPDSSTPTTKCPVPAAPIASESEKLPTNNTIDEAQVKKSRVKYTPVQLETLEKAFNDTPYPDWDEMEELSKKLNVAEQKIKVWFQNKRARWRKKQTAQQLQDVPAFKPLPQMSALYRFPCSAPSFIQPNQKHTGMFPSNMHSNVISHPFPGQHYTEQSTYRAPTIATQIMPAQPWTNNFGFPTNESFVLSRATETPGPLPSLYRSPMMQNGASGLPSGPQPNYGNFGNVSNNYMYPNT